MLHALTQIGKSYTQGPLGTLIDKTNAENIFVIKLDKNCKYVGLTVESKTDEELYLYKRAKEGLPGKFITGRISRIDLLAIKRLLTKSEGKPKKLVGNLEYEKFKKNKIGWVNKPLILRDQEILKQIPKKSSLILDGIIKEIIKKQDKIMHDFCILVSQGDYKKDVLLTVKVNSKYLKEIEGFSQILKIASQGKEQNSISDSHCLVCNHLASGDELKEPLPFFTLDKPNFLPDGNYKNQDKVFSLCRKCYHQLQKGSRYIQENLLFNIPNTGGSTRIWFWLIPLLNDPSLVNQYVKRQDKGLASFKSLFQISTGLDLSKKLDLSMAEIDADKNSINYFLSYIALFFHYDEQKHMRLVSTVDGIYPSRLKEIYKIKYDIDRITEKNNTKFKFHFGLLVDFLEVDDDEGWMKKLTYMMSCIFTKKIIDLQFITNVLLEKLKPLLVNRELSKLFDMTVKAELILEFMFRAGNLLSKQENNLDKMLKSDLGIDKTLTIVKEFLDSHAGMLYNRNLRAICSLGVVTGIVIKSQKRYLGSDTFISRLNRFEMDYTRLSGLYSQAFIKLKHYHAEEFTDLFTFLANYEISNLDINQNLSQEYMNLVFAIGVAHGFILFDSYLKERK